MIQSSGAFLCNMVALDAICSILLAVIVVYTNTIRATCGYKKEVIPLCFPNSMNNSSDSFRLNREVGKFTTYGANGFYDFLVASCRGFFTTTDILCE